MLVLALHLKFSVVQTKQQLVVSLNCVRLVSSQANRHSTAIPIRLLFLRSSAWMNVRRS